jgi:6-phosphogluconolactonase
VKPELKRFLNIEALSRAAVELVVEAAAKSIARDGRFSLALSGGKTPRRLYELLNGAPMDWRKTHLFWGDERCVPRTDPASNYGMAAKALLSGVSVPPQNVHAMPVEIGSPTMAASAYEQELRSYFRGLPTFDLILLGMGPDGHTASLLPGSLALDEKQRWVVAVDGKGGNPPVPRLSLTFPAINSARQALFLVTGKDKAPVVDAIMKGSAVCPAARVAPLDRLDWYCAD